MDKRKGLINVVVSVLFKIFILLGQIFVRRFLISEIGNGVNGLNSLYVSLIGFLSVAELGVGSAITYCMYQPIVEGNIQKVSALYRLFVRLYVIIGTVIFAGGLLLLPFLRYFAADYTELNVDLYLTFFLMLLSVVITYAFSAKSSLINAHKNNYITTAISSVGQLLQFGAQIAVILLTRSFVYYLLCAIANSLFQWLLTELVARRSYQSILRQNESVDRATKREVVKNVKAMFLHKIGGTLVNTADSVIISAFIGVVLLGKYTNYTTIVTALSGVLALLFSPLTSVIGHLFIEEQTALKKYFNFFHTFNFIIGTVFFLGYYAVIDPLVALCFDAGGTGDLTLSKSISFVITLNYFIQFMRQTVLLFKDATGAFYFDRWKPLVEGVLNIALSVLFVQLFGVVGVIAATILTNLFICHIVEPYVLYKHIFHKNATGYYMKNYAYLALFLAALVVLSFLTVTGNGLTALFINGAIAVGVSIAPCVVAAALDKNFRGYLKKSFAKAVQTHRTRRKNIEKN